MPNNVIKAWSKADGVPKKKMEHNFKKAESIAAKSGKKGNYKYVMGIFKKMSHHESTDASSLRSFIMENL